MKALLADDDVISRMAMTDMLAVLRQLKITEAADGEAAWSQLESGFAPVICFFDIRMPGFDGLTLLQKMRADARFSGIPVMLITGTPERDVVVQAGKLAVDGFIVKPVDGRQTLERIERVISRFEKEVLDDVETVARRLGIKPERYAQYILAMVEQTEKLIEQLRSADTMPAKAAFNAIGTAAQTLCARHLNAANERACQLILNGMASSNHDEIQQMRTQAAAILDVAILLVRDRARESGVKMADRTVIAALGTTAAGDNAVAADAQTSQTP